MTSKASNPGLVVCCAVLISVGGLLSGCNGGGSAAVVSDEDRKAFLSHPDPKHPPKEMFDYMKAHNVAAPQGPPAAAPTAETAASTAANPSPATN